MIGLFGPPGFPFLPGTMLLPSQRAQRAVTAEAQLAASRAEVAVKQRKISELEEVIRRQKNLLARYQGINTRKLG